MAQARTGSGMCGRQHVVVVGGGFAGMNAAHALRHSSADVTLVDQHNYNTFQPLLYQVSTGYLPAEEVGAALRSVFGRQDNLTVRVGTAAAVDWTDRTLRLQDSSALDFDYLILATGAETNFFGIAGMAAHAWPLYTLADAVRLRTHLLVEIEHAVGLAPSGGPQLTVVVVGGGATGVETAGALASMAREVVGPVAAVRVVLVEAGGRLLTSFSPRSSRRALEHLRRGGVDVRLGRTVAAADDQGVTLDGGERIETGTVVWAAGVQANGLGHALGLDLTRHGRVLVDQWLQVPSHPGVFVAGDLAAARAPGRQAASEPSAPLPMLAPVAIQTGRYVGEQVAQLIEGKPLARFQYHDKGMLAVLGRGDAVAELPLPFGANGGGRYPLRFAGLPAWLLWGGVHIVYLIGFRNRIKVLVDWGWSYLTSRGAGAILLRSTDGLQPDALQPGDARKPDASPADPGAASAREFTAAVDQSAQ